MNKRIRIVIALVITLLTAGAFAYYLNHHSYLLKQLTKTSPLTIIGLLLLYGAWFTALAAILHVSVRLCRTTLGIKENFLLNSYSTLVNFFVPGQGGLVVRGAYLKKNNKLRVSDYVFVSLLYYLFYAVVSAFLLLAGSRPWWQTVLGLVVTAGGSALVITWYARRRKTDEKRFDLRFSTLGYLVLAVVAQAIIQIAIYYVELHSVNTRVSLWHVMAYTGAANFALFVSLTPAGIGIRESFLLFTEKLNHLSSATIVKASIIDRAVFILFLAIVFVLVISFNVKDKLHVKSLQTADKSADA